MKACIRTASALFCTVLLGIVSAFCVSAADEQEPGGSYLYSSKGKAVSAPEAYSLKQTIDAASVGIGNFEQLADMDIDCNGNLYLLDSKKNQVVVLNSDYKLAYIINEFKHGEITDGFSEPSGISVSRDGNIYIADTENQRIVVLTYSGEYVKIIEAPERELAQYSYEYKPYKVAADAQGRVYVIAKNQTQGIFAFDAKNKFIGYIGATKVKPDFTELFFRMFASKQQKEASLQFIPTEYSNISIDSENFIYAVISSVDNEQIESDISANNSTVKPVRRLSHDGSDITVQNGFAPSVGELSFDPYAYGTLTGASNFTDVADGKNGIFSVLDAKRGRIFTYDSQGNLLYIFGGRGNKNGEFNIPSAIVYSGDDILVADESRGTVQVFEPTEYAECIMNAISDYNNGDYASEYNNWLKVSNMYCGSELAYLGIGRYYYNQKQYRKAMDCFKLADNRDYYSKAVNKYIDTVGQKALPWLAFLIIAAFAIHKLYKRKRSERPISEKGKLYLFWKRFKYSAYIMFHPFDGFWDLKYEKRGGVLPATLLLVLATAVYTVNIRFKAFTFNTFDSENESAFLKGFEGVALLILLWCVANWSITTLMDGKGSMKDIYCYMCYSLLPIIILLPIATLFSYILPLEAEALLSMICTVGVIWTAFLIFCGTATTHHYSAAKTVASSVLTMLGILIILFLFMLTITLVQQMIAFVSLLVKEVTLRT